MNLLQFYGEKEKQPGHCCISVIDFDIMTSNNKYKDYQTWIAWMLFHSVWIWMEIWNCPVSRSSNISSPFHSQCYITTCTFLAEGWLWKCCHESKHILKTWQMSMNWKSGLTLILKRNNWKCLTLCLPREDVSIGHSML